ncbi:MAG: serine acetyltransferase [Spirochaetales bacterium]|uniref:Serine acetyltransferase n=1 Tax=Candidatus Thalassospirochaeta sargassi TaxID=3119039 RepID=A0AAJ1MPK2_9SPIO|nr:serine acetyltransferase [Spirochaetales bacterium]
MSEYHTHNSHGPDLRKLTEQLCTPESYSRVYHRTNEHDIHMPSTEELAKTVELLRSVIFPGYYIHSELREETMHYYIGSTLDKCYTRLSEQLRRGYCFACNSGSVCHVCESKADEAASELLQKLPYIRHMLATDAQAAYDGDPAARSIGEAIFCYPSIRALTNHRIAHELYKIGVPIIPRMISEMAHSEAGIDIHPGAQIDEYFFIDHGTGVVIGETSIIGKHVTLYQGVTLGAKNFPKDENGNPIKDVPRHPIVRDDAIIYAGATILGRVTIGEKAVIGGNLWITRDVADGEKVHQRRGD